MTSVSEHLAGHVGSLIDLHDDDKHAFRELAALPTCWRCKENKGTVHYENLGVSVCEPCAERIVDWSQA